jgi:nucleoside-diphosphate-sugar epimerase
VVEFLKSNGWNGPGIQVLPYDLWGSCSCDLVINAAGSGDPQVIRKPGLDLIRCTEHFDYLTLDYLKEHPQTGYIYLSSGAVYGPPREEAVTQDSVVTLPINRLTAGHAYSIAKIAAETRHRLLPDFKIADVRIFGFFSRYINPKAGFFLSEVAACLLENRSLVTHSRNFIRDYIGAPDLAMLIRNLMAAGIPNGAYDACSEEPVTKLEILESLQTELGLRWRTLDGLPIDRLSVEKPKRISVHQSAADIAFQPKERSLMVIQQELRVMLERN